VARVQKGEKGESGARERESEREVSRERGEHMSEICQRSGIRDQK
jgi:hypothetical protein